ncbi:MAG: hypothetical protein PHC78_00225, partial [Verrucomicrobiota bacterium]|nr:hypothetical protein [Verrucomicrobiota bacterium]
MDAIQEWAGKRGSPAENGNGTFLHCDKVQNDKEEGTIPQAILPILPPGATPINNWVSVDCQDKTWTY